MLCTFYGGYCSLWPNRTARSLSRAWPSLLRAHNHIGGATAVPLHHKKCLLCSVLIYIVLDAIGSREIWIAGIFCPGSIRPGAFRPDVFRPGIVWQRVFSGLAPYAWSWGLVRADLSQRDAVAVPGCHLDAAVPTAAAVAAAISSPSAAAAEAAAAVSRSFLYEHLVHIVGVVLQHPVFSGEHAKHHWRQLPPVAGLQRQRLATKHTSARCQQPSITTASR